MMVVFKEDNEEKRESSKEKKNTLHKQKRLAAPFVCLYVCAKSFQRHHFCEPLLVSGKSVVSFLFFDKTKGFY